MRSNNCRQYILSHPLAPPNTQTLTNLPTIDNFLVENAKLITDSITISCQAQRRHRVEEASYREREEFFISGNQKYCICQNSYMQFSEKLNNIESNLPDGPDLRCPGLHPPQCPGAPPYPDPTTQKRDLDKINPVHEKYLLY